MLAVLVTRLGRIVDRSRALDEPLESALERRKDHAHAELRDLSRRSRLTERAIVLATAAGIFVCLVIITLFVDYLLVFNVSMLVVAFFLLAMPCFIGAFSSLLSEVMLATA